MIVAAKLHEVQMQLNTLAGLRDKLARRCFVEKIGEPLAGDHEGSAGCSNIVDELTKFLDGPAIRLMDLASDGDEAALARLLRATLKLQGFTAEAADEQLENFQNLTTAVQETIADAKTAVTVVGGLAVSSIALYALIAGAVYLIAFRKAVV